MATCCKPTQQPHFVVIGGGSAAFAAALKAHGLKARVTIINAGLPIGGTCVNVGCVPSKSLIRQAEAVHRASHCPFEGIKTEGKVEDFRKIIGHTTHLVEELRQKKYVDVVAKIGEICLIEGKGRLLDARTVQVNGQRLVADKILIATGSATKLPPVEGLDGIDYLTPAKAFSGDRPESLLVLGGRYIALECAQMFARFGTRVTILQRSSRILPDETEDITTELTRLCQSEGIEIITDVQMKKASQGDDGVKIEALVDGEPRAFSAEKVLVATGTAANVHDMGLEEAGVVLDERGFIKADEFCRTTAESVYAAGDVIGNPQFVYTAAYEGNLAATNALSKSLTKRDYNPLPWVVFTDPQLGGVGMNETMARAAGINFQASVAPLSKIPRSIAAQDMRGFIKLIRDKDTDLLVGARILSPEGGELLMQASLAIKYGAKTQDLASMFFPYLTLSEGIKLAALGFTQDIDELSCCATK
jgi:mercuric reductase